MKSKMQEEEEEEEEEKKKAMSVNLVFVSEPNE